MEDLKKNVFIVWHPFPPRAAGLSKCLKSKTLFLNHLIKSRGIIWKLFNWADYLYKTVVTFFFLIRNNPEIVFAQSPPSFCPMVCLFYCQIFSRKLVIDCHDSTFHKPWFSVPFFKKTLELASVVIIHNNELANYLKKKHGNFHFFVLNDKLKNFDSLKNNHDLNHEKYFLVVLIYDPYEPVDELLEAIRQFLNVSGEEIKFKLTGNYLKRRDLYNSYNNLPGLEYLGIVSREDYEDLLSNALGVIALRNRDMKQSCTVAEAVGANVPLISSNTDTNRNLLFDGSILTSADINSIKNAISKLISERSKLLKGIGNVRSHWEQKWENDFTELIMKLKKS